MLAKDTLSSAEFRRTKAEAAEIALRGAHLRPRPDAHVYEGADIQRILGIPEVGTAEPDHDNADRDPWFGALLGCFYFLALGVMAFALIAATVWLVTLIDWQALRDFIAPTAAQARDTGWVALSEGL